ncbi:putative protein S-acyltransferase 23 [Bidens hawaiensis]|uniref:putative protein S-acyltransferase 23 n=1 Tax=Bidens hawaiensis TaxID=980011 RepID=UPI00404AB21D
MIGLLSVEGGVVDMVECGVVGISMVKVWVRKDVVMVRSRLMGSVVVAKVCMMGFVIVDVFGACAYGDLLKLIKFVEQDGVSVNQPDGNGYYPLQWAALNNVADVVHYIIEHGGDVHAVDHVGQTALHWAAAWGSLAAAEVLLQNGARVEAADVNAYRAVHVAAQYGQTSFLNYIVAKYHADFDASDNDGRTPLHWAAYKGFVDTIRLLLFLGRLSRKTR